MMTIGSRLDAHGGFGPGFDFVRLALSFAILFFHCWRVSYGPHGQPLNLPVTENFVAGLLPLFFALSGFLVMGSASRNPGLGRFLAFRAIRILPALTTEIVLSALLLGPLVTSLSWRDYFSDPLFYEYFGSLIGKVSVLLPGVFLSNPDPEYVNLSLWTIGPELLCYTYLSIVLFLRINLNIYLMTALILFVVAINVTADVVMQSFLSSDGIANPRLLFVCFSLGNLMYLWRHSIISSRIVFFMSACIGLLFIKTIGMVYISAFFLCYAVVFAGLSNLRLPKFFANGDYSYGIYLYAYPIQQTVSYMLPELREWYVNLVISAPITVFFAYLSWNLIEKPALTLRRYVPAADRTIRVGWLGNYVCLSLLLCYGLFLIRDYGLPWQRFGGTYAMIIPSALLIAFGVVAAQWLRAGGRRRARKRLGSA